MASSNEVLRLPYKTVNNVSIPTDIHIPTSTQRSDRHDLAPVLIMIHGGGFMLGHSKMNNMDIIEDCLERGWIVLSIEHRLCPGVNVLEGPMTDVKDSYLWAKEGGLAKSLQDASCSIKPDPDRVMVMGTSAGGHLALSLAWTVPVPPLAILDFYGVKNFEDPFWTSTIPPILSKLPPAPPSSFYAHLFEEKETFQGGVSLEGQASSGPDFSDPRQSFVFQNIGHGTILNAIWPQTPKNLDLIDPVLNVHKSWPPTAFVHGTADIMVPMHLSHNLEKKLKEQGIETRFLEVEGEPHTFVGKMVKGSQTWNTQRQGFDFLEDVLKRSYV